MKKQLMKELPRMERSLCDVLEDWEESHENFFMVFDARYLDTMKAQWEGKRLLKCHELIKKVCSCHYFYNNNALIACIVQDLSLFILLRKERRRPPQSWR